MRKATGNEYSHVERIDTKRRYSDLHFGAAPGMDKASIPIMTNFEDVRENIRIHSHGIFIAPHLPPKASKLSPAHATKVTTSAGSPELPPRSDFAILSRSYLASVHEWYPILHWPTFQREVDDAYTTTGLEEKPREWIALFFAVLACGSLQVEQGLPHSELKQPLPYFDISAQHLTPWSQELTIDHVQAAFLLSIFAGENNWGPSGSMWLGLAVRSAQELHLNCDGPTSSIVEKEIGRRLWWAIYTQDRY